MPRAFDRRTPIADKDPLRSATDWTDPQGSISDAAAVAGNTINDAVQASNDKAADSLAKAVANWTKFWADMQAFIDGIAGLFKPGVSGAPVQDAINAILGIKDSATAAQEYAQLALIGIARIEAERAGGGWDEFDYPAADVLPAADYTPFYGGDKSNTSTWGPDGNGRLIYKPKGTVAGIAIGIRSVMYRRNTLPITKATGSVTVKVSKAPNLLAKDAYIYVAGQWSATDQSRVQAQIHQTGQLFGQTSTVWN